MQKAPRRGIDERAVFDYGRLEIISKLGEMNKFKCEQITSCI